MSRLSLGSLALAPALVCAGCVASVACDEPGALCFAAADPLHLRVGFRPDALVFIDLDADGERDLVGASGLAGTLTAVWGGPDGFTAAATTWSIGQELTGLVVADLDADGRLDLATALPHADAVAVLRGRGGRQFGLPAHHPAGAIPRALLAADLDGTGPPELVTANLGDGTLTVLRDFIADPPIVVGPGPRALASGDFDRDGRLDIAVALADIDAVQVMRGDGHGGLWPATLHPVGAAPYAIIAADLDRDGHLDLATADALDDTISVLWADSSGELQRRIAWPTLSQPSALVVAEPDGALPVLGVLSEVTATIQQLDPRSGQTLPGVPAGAPLALTADGAGFLTSGAAVVYMSKGTGIITTELWQSPGVYNAWPVDLDGDGIDELVVRDRDTEAGTLNLRRGGDEPPVPISTGLEYPDSVWSADLTGDHRADLLVHSGGSFAVVVQQPDGSLLPGAVMTAPGVHDVAIADLDGDAIAEVLLLTSDSHLSILRSDEAGEMTLVETHDLELDEAPYHLRVIDGDGDATPDLLLAHHEALYYLEDARTPALRLPLDGQAVSIDLEIADLDHNGHLDGLYCGFDGAFAVHDIFSPAPSDPVRQTGMPCSGLHVLDLDRDGVPELLTYEYAYSLETFNTRLRPWVNTGDQWIPRGPRLLKSTHSGNLRLAQLDGDGVPDLLLLGFDRVDAMQIELGPSLVETDLVRLSARPGLQFGDIDGDGAADLVTHGSSLAVAYADGDGGFGPLSHQWIAPSLGDPKQIPHAILTDFNRDGVGDIVWALRTAGSPFYKLLSATLTADGLQSPHTVADLGGTEFQLFPGDLDGDGALDLIALDSRDRLSGHMIRGHGDGRFAPRVALDLELNHPTNRLGLHDVNGDGHLDLLATYSSLPMDSGGILLWPGIGDGTFAAVEQWSDVVAAYWDLGRLVFGDFDRDGRVELVMTSPTGLMWIHGGADRDVRVVLGRADAVAAADLDLDGHLELVATSALAGDMTALHVGRSRSDGSFAFTPPITVATTDVREIQAADIDGDGDLDIALIDPFGATIVRQQP